MSESLFDLLARELGRLLEPISYALENERARERLLTSVGVVTTGDEHVPALLDVLTAVSSLKARLDELAARSSPSLGDIAAVLELSGKAFSSLRALSATGGPADAFEGLGHDLADFLFANYLTVWHPLAKDIAALLTLVELAYEREMREPVIQDSRILRESFRLDGFRLGRLVALLRDPAAALRSEYLNSLATADDAKAVAQKFFTRLQRVLRDFGLSCRYGVSPGDEELLGDDAPFIEHALIVYVQDILAGAESESGVVLNISSAEQGDLGLVVSPFGTLTFTNEIGAWSLDVALTTGVDVFAYGRHGLTLLANTDVAQVTGRFSSALAAPDEGPAFLFGSPTGTRLEVGGVLIEAKTSLSEARQSLTLSADVSKSAIVIAPRDGDGFLSRVLSAEGVRVEFDLGLTWSNEHGLSFRGTTGLDSDVPIGLAVGGLSVPSIHLALIANDSNITTEVSANVSASIGPFVAVINRAGLTSVLSFPEDGGNLGVANLDFRFKPPSGIGLAIEAPSVRGGGYLELKNDEYSGVLELQIAEKISVKAIGVLTTRMPGGGYSLVGIIFVERFTPIQLGLGFSLTGIGGLFAINRTFDEEALRAGLKNHALDSVLFPVDPVRNAPQIISNINKLFPLAVDHYLFGPMLQIAWGTPPLITAEVAVVLEFGARQRLLILAQVAAILPEKDNDLVRLKMDAFGVIDFDQGTASLDATLYDSRLVKKFVLTGDMAMRLKWKSPQNFALAVGGLHRAFNPPPNFPKLARVAINLTTGNNPRFLCEAYFAITANTLQFGARAELYAAAHGFSIQGHVGFDVLLQRQPFYFVAEFSAQLQLKKGNFNLFKVSVDGALSGPRPLNIRGKATFEILWWDVSIRFDTTLIEGEDPEPAVPVDVLPLLKEALTSPANWVAALPQGRQQMVTLKPRVAADKEIALHPLGSLTVKQTVVPLDTVISRFGSAVPSGANRFTVSAVGMSSTPVTDYFAPAQFFEMTDDEKISSPSFESKTAGIKFGSEAFSIPADDLLEVIEIKFETYRMKFEGNKAHLVPEDASTLTGVSFERQYSYGAVGSSKLNRTARARRSTKFRKYELADEEWAIVDSGFAVPSDQPIDQLERTNYRDGVNAVRHANQQNAETSRLTVVRLSELL